MDCELARQLLVFARPGATELDAADVAALESHLADCDACRMVSRNERSWDDRLAHAMRTVAIPTDGRARLDRRLRGEQWSWRWGVTGMAFGIVLLAGGIWWGIPGPRFDAETVAADAYDQVGNRDGVEVWLLNQDSHFGFPPRMDAKYLVACERRDFHGVKAPVLTFVRQNAMARVAVLSARQFRNASGLPTGRLAENSVCTVLIVRDPDWADVVYVVEVINGPVELFYNEIDATVN